MKANWKLIGMGVGAAALLAYPAIKLYQYIAKRLEDASAQNDKETPVKTMRILHNHKHTPHHRVAHN